MIRDLLLKFDFFAYVTLMVVILRGFQVNNQQFREHMKVLHQILDSLKGGTPTLLAERVKFYLLNDRGQFTLWGGKMIVKADAAPKKFRVKFEDKFGNAAPVDGKPSVSLLNNDAGLASVTLGEAMEGQLGVYEGELTFLGKAGMTQIDLVADADMDPSVQKELRAQSEEIQILAADASVVKIEFLAEEVPLPVEPLPVEPTPEVAKRK